MYFVFYVFMIVMLIVGWLILSMVGKFVLFFGLEFFLLVSENKDFVKMIKELYEIVGEVGYYLIGIYVVVVLVYYYFLVDNILKCMLFLKSEYLDKFE